MTGVMQLLLASARAGFLVDFLSSPVVCGFTSAAAIFIAISQLGNLLGFSLASARRWNGRNGIPESECVSVVTHF